MGWMEETQKRIGLRVRSVRKEKGLTQAKLAEMGGLPTETVNRIERGAEPNPTLRVLGSIAQALGLGLHELFLPDKAYDSARRGKVFEEIRESLCALSGQDVTLIRGLSRRMKELAGAGGRRGRS